MKTMFAVVALATAALAAPVLAQEAPDGHYEWEARQVPGPNKSSPADCMKKMAGDLRTYPGA